MLFLIFGLMLTVGTSKNLCPASFHWNVASAVFEQHILLFSVFFAYVWELLKVM